MERPHFFSLLVLNRTDSLARGAATFAFLFFAATGFANQQEHAPAAQIRPINTDPKPDLLAEKNIICDPVTLVCDFSKAVLTLDLFADPREKPFVEELEARYPGISEELTNRRRTQIIQIDDSVIVPPGPEGYMRGYSSEGHKARVNHVLGNCVEALDLFIASSKARASYSAGARGWWKDRKAGDRIEEDFLVERAEMNLKMCRQELALLGFTDEATLSQLDKEWKKALLADAENLKAHLSNLTKTMIVAPLAAFAIPVAIYAAGALAVSGAATAGVATTAKSGAAIKLATAGLVAGAGSDGIMQSAEIRDGTRESYSPLRTVGFAAAGAVVGPLAGAAPAALTVAAGTTALINEGYEAVASARDGNYWTAGAHGANTLLSLGGTALGLRRPKSITAAKAPKEYPKVRDPFKAWAERVARLEGREATLPARNPRTVRPTQDTAPADSLSAWVSPELADDLGPVLARKLARLEQEAARVAAARKPSTTSPVPPRTGAPPSGGHSPPLRRTPRVELPDSVDASSPLATAAAFEGVSPQTAGRAGQLLARKLNLIGGRVVEVAVRARSNPDSTEFEPTFQRAIREMSRVLEGTGFEDVGGGNIVNTTTRSLVIQPRPMRSTADVDGRYAYIEGRLKELYDLALILQARGGVQGRKNNPFWREDPTFE